MKYVGLALAVVLGVSLSVLAFLFVVIAEVRRVES